MNHSLSSPLRWLLPWAVLAWLLAGGAALAQPASQRESAVKAAFLFKFPAFVEWPAGSFRTPDHPVVIGVLGNDAVASDLEQLAASRHLDGRPVTVRRLAEGEPPAGVHLLFVGATTPARLRESVAAAAGPVLVVAEQEGGLRAGAVLNFTQEEGRVRFGASLAAAEARGLRLSSRLLAVASAVEGRTR
ncbi:YfiR family protein [Ramlibacter tataouinensis]|uniref:YfiR family protein n=1 Tax=Ramlibacter tataouinensis TaxID=94132 RepID=UPI00030F4827|nr:YfiR family protein [Ramlibacter tataouinensis]